MEIARSERRHGFSSAWALCALGLSMILLAWAGSACRRSQKADVPTLRVITADELGEHLKQFHAPITLVHVWATWCGPCREEFPDVLRLRQDYVKRGLDVVLVSADAPDERAAVERYLGERDVHSASFLIDNPNAAFINTLCTNWSGALPASFFFAPGGRLQRWWEGKAEYAHYREVVEQLLEPAQTRR